MYLSNQGYGIAGAKNIYSSKVKLGNWVEDQFGQMHTEKPREPIKLYETNTMNSYISPDQMPVPKNMPVNMPSTQELKAKNKEGLPYSLLFNHGLKDFPSDERFQTTAMTSMKQNGSNYVLPEKTLERQKSKKMLEDINLAYVKSTEQRNANKFISFTPGPPNIALGKTAELPNWHKQNLTKSL